MELETARLCLREWDMKDVDAFGSFMNDPEVMKYLYFPQFTHAGSEALVRSSLEAKAAEPRLNYILGVQEKTDPALIGWCGVIIRDAQEREAELGFTLARHVWGKGYATEAAWAALNFAFGELSLHRVFATAHPENLASRRILEKIGMTYEGTLRQHKWARTRWRDSALYAILETEWSGQALG